MTAKLAEAGNTTAVVRRKNKTKQNKKTDVNCVNATTKGKGKEHREIEKVKKSCKHGTPYLQRN